MKKLAIFIIASGIILACSPGIRAQSYADNVVQRGVYYPYFFAELLDLQIRDDLAFVSGVGGLAIVDISSLHTPKLVGRFDPGSIWRRFYTSALYGALAVGCARLDGLYFVNVRDPRTPQLLTIYKEPNTAFEAAAIRDSILYAAAHDRGVLLFDIRDTSKPVPIGALTEAQNAWDVLLLPDEILVVADGSGRVHFYRLQAGKTPSWLASQTTSGSARDLAYQDELLFVATGSSGMDILDISSPERPQFLSNYRHLGVVNHLDVAGNYAFLANWRGIEVVETTDPSRPVRVATERTPVRAMSVAAKDSSTLVVADWAQVETFSFHNVANPDIEIDRPTLFFFQKISGEQTVASTPVRNEGTAPLILSAPASSSGDFLARLDRQTLLPGESATLSVEYRGAFSSAKVAAVQLESSDPDESPVSVQLSVEMSGLHVGDFAADFSLPDTDGLPHRLSDYRGQIVVLVFFASW